MNTSVRQTHLQYYREHQITPVRYDLRSMDSHLSRRFALYSKLGLLPLTFANASVLEVAAGTGQNSLYVAQCKPSRLVLLEPNATGVSHIHESYTAFSHPHTAPEIIVQTLEDYSPENTFDIVLCENWLGTSAHEQSLLTKLAGMVSIKGIVVLTTVSPIGIVPNLLRRFLALHLAPDIYNFQKRTELLVSAFDSHLDTLTNMTRSSTDWVQDNMLNPAYFGLCLSIPNLLNRLNNQFEVVASSPVFAEDWRWFKGLHGQRNYSEQFLAEYWKKAHNFLDYRQEPFVGHERKNLALEKKAFQLLDAIASHEDAYLRKDTLSIYAKNVLKEFDDFIYLIPEQFSISLKGLQEVRELISSPSSINIASVSSMSDFSGLFGRETVYVSLIKVE